MFGPESDPKRKDTIYIVDFGLAKYYIDPNTGRHIDMGKTEIWTGTMRYMSVNAHKLRVLSRRDDMESIGYVLLYFVRKGQLPWMNLHGLGNTEKHDKIATLKSKPLEELCKGVPPVMTDYFSAIRQMQFYATPDYKLLRQLFVNYMSHNAIAHDGKFHWPMTTKSEQSDSSLQSR